MVQLVYLEKKNASKNSLTTGGQVRLPILFVGQNQKPLFLKTESLADTLFMTKIICFWERKFFTSINKNFFFEKKHFSFFSEKKCFFGKYFFKKIKKIFHKFFMGRNLFDILKKSFRKTISKKTFFFQKKRKSFLFFKQSSCLSG